MRVTITTDQKTMDGLEQVLKSLLVGPLKNPKLTFSKVFKRDIEQFLRDYQDSLMHKGV